MLPPGTDASSVYDAPPPAPPAPPYPPRYRIAALIALILIPLLILGIGYLFAISDRGVVAPANSGGSSDPPHSIAASPPKLL